MANDQPKRLTEAIKEVVGEDKELQDRIRKFINNALDHAEDILRNGSTPQRNQLVSKMVPSIVREMKTKDEESDAIKEMRQAQDELMKEMRESKTQATPTPTPGLEVDHAPSSLN